MTSFDDRFAECAGQLLDNLGESVVYKPTGGAPRTITAMVTRNPPQPAGDAPPTDYLHVDVYDDSATGISKDELTAGQDEIELYDLVGRNRRTRVIQLVVDRNGGMLKLAVQ